MMFCFYLLAELCGVSLGEQFIIVDVLHSGFIALAGLGAEVA